MRIIALINQKGGCGKTTTAINVSACLGHHGKRVLLIDLDPQGHASLGLGVSPEGVSQGMASVLSREASLEDVLVKGIFPGLDLAPSNLRLAALEQQLSGQPQREERLLGALRQLSRPYDYILIDAPPSLGLLSFNALRVADEVLIPVDASSFSLHGLKRLLETLEMLQARTGQRVDTFALATLFSRTRFGHEVLEMLSTDFPKSANGRRYQTIIRSTVRVREAAGRGVPIIHYDPDAIAAQDYESLVQEVLQREQEITKVAREAATTGSPGLSLLPQGALLTWEGSEEAPMAGEFNDWVPDRKVYALPGQGGKTRRWLPLAPGRYAYRIRISGKWREDPLNPKVVEHPSHGKSSLLEISAP